jgi:LacI family transcriptional regulator
VLHAVRCAGLRVPADVAVVGFDDLSFSPFLAPPLTTVRLPFDDMGRAAVAWLVKAVRGQTTEPLCELHQPELIVRESA